MSNCIPRKLSQRTTSLGKTKIYIILPVEAKKTFHSKHSNPPLKNFPKFLKIVVYLTLPLLILEIAVEQNDARFLDASFHARVHDILVQHYTMHDTRVLDRAAGDLMEGK